MAKEKVERQVVSEEEEEEKWVKHYSSTHQILLVGEGDFSFSLSLAMAFGSASNILATSKDSYDDLIKKYKNAKSNLENLDKMGASLLHKLDATSMKLHTDLNMRKFDRIIFNFPHAGFNGKEDNKLMIQKHRRLVSDFFKNGWSMLRPDGEIHVNHKTKEPFCLWNIEELASENSLVLVDCVDFKIEDYPGYNNKRGDGSSCDEPFHLGKCKTYKFRFYRAPKKCYRTVPALNPRKLWQFERQEKPTLFEFNHIQRDQVTQWNHNFLNTIPPLELRETTFGFNNLYSGGVRNIYSDQYETMHHNFRHLPSPPILGDRYRQPFQMHQPSVSHISNTTYNLDRIDFQLRTGVMEEYFIPFCHGSGNLIRLPERTDFYVQSGFHESRFDHERSRIWKNHHMNDKIDEMHRPRRQYGPPEVAGPQLWC